MNRVFLVVVIAFSPGDRGIELSPPIAGLDLKLIRNSFTEVRGQGFHEAIDIPVPKGTPVLAVTRGTVAKLFLSKPGGKTIYLFDEQARYCYYYAHLDGYAEGLRDGSKVRAGEVIGYVGSTGNADPRSPHLHFTIFELGPEKQYWKGTVINPYPYVLSAVEKERRTIQ
jgi:murein DD-endopeptidase MepM/ murein hydrolase activator NlpD